MCWGASWVCLWNSDTSLLIPLTSLDGLHLSCSMLYPFHYMRYSSSLRRPNCLGYAPLHILQLHHQQLGMKGHVELALQWCTHCWVTAGWLRIWGVFSWMMMVVWVNLCIMIWPCWLGVDQATCGSISSLDESWWCSSHWTRLYLQLHIKVLPSNGHCRSGPYHLLLWWELNVLPLWSLPSWRQSH